MASGHRSLADRSAPDGARARIRLRAVETRRRGCRVARERATHVWLAIDKLPEKLRLVVVLSAIEGHDTREVAGLLDVPEGTVENLRWLVTDSPKR